MGIMKEKLVKLQSQIFASFLDTLEPSSIIANVALGGFLNSVHAPAIKLAGKTSTIMKQRTEMKQVFLRQYAIEDHGVNLTPDCKYKWITLTNKTEKVLRPAVKINDGPSI